MKSCKVLPIFIQYGRLRALMENTLDQVNKALKKKFSTKKIIFGQGFVGAKVVFVVDPPTQKEIKASVPFLKEVIKTIQPLFVVTLGTTALNGMGLRQPLVNVRGRVFN